MSVVLFEWPGYPPIFNRQNSRYNLSEFITLPAGNVLEGGVSNQPFVGKAGESIHLLRPLPVTAGPGVFLVTITGINHTGLPVFAVTVVTGLVSLIHTADRSGR